MSEQKWALAPEHDVDPRLLGERERKSRAVPFSDRGAGINKATSRTNQARETCRWRVLRGLDPASLKLFIAVIEEGTIAAAAAREYVVATSVSKRISKLEATLQTQLVSRTNRGLTPTAAGIALLNLGRRVLLDLEEIYSQMDHYSSGTQGHVRMCANIAAITQFLPAELKCFLTEHPRVQIHLEEKISMGVAKAVAENAAHIGIFTMDTPHGHSLETFPYRSDRVVVVTPIEHPLAGKRAVSFEETLDFEYVGLNSGSAISLQLLKAAMRAPQDHQAACSSHCLRCPMPHGRGWTRDRGSADRRSQTLRRHPSPPRHYA